MNNLKKIGMTALAASLVSTSAFAGAMTVTGSASINSEGHSSTQTNAGTTFSMGNQLTFSGSGELDNGLNVSVSFVLDQFDDAHTSSVAHTGSTFDGHSVSVGSDTFGTLKFSGEGGSSAASALDTTAAGDMWDNFNSNTGVTVTDSGPGDNSFYYTLPSLVDSLTVNASYKPQGATAASATGYSATYAGVEGLSVSYGTTDINTGAAATDGDQTVMKASYAYGPVTVAYSNNDIDIAGTGSDQETTSMNLSYTVSDAISVSYGTEEIAKVGSIDAEYDGFKASYTSGGMTLSASMQDGKNVDHSTDAVNQVEYWSLGLSFAF